MMDHLCNSRRAGHETRDRGIGAGISVQDIVAVNLFHRMLGIRMTLSLLNARRQVPNLCV